MRSEKFRLLLWLGRNLWGKLSRGKNRFLWKGTEAQAARSQAPSPSRYFLSRKEDTLCPGKKSVFL